MSLILPVPLSRPREESEITSGVKGDRDRVGVRSGKGRIKVRDMFSMQSGRVYQALVPPMLLFCHSYMFPCSLKFALITRLHPSFIDVPHPAEPEEASTTHDDKVLAPAPIAMHPRYPALKPLSTQCHPYPQPAKP